MFKPKLVKVLGCLVTYVFVVLVCHSIDGPGLSHAYAWNAPGGPTKDVANLAKYIPHKKYHPKGHAYIIEHAFDILENDGYRNWAEIARSFRKEILNGVRFADTKLGRQRIYVALKLFGIEVEDFGQITSFPIAGQGHYFNPERFDSKIRRFSEGDKSGLNVPIKKFFEGVGPYHLLAAGLWSASSSCSLCWILRK
ncbi:hypothetical protein ACFLT2_08665 [Acidobacteriota bacterium]